MAGGVMPAMPALVSVHVFARQERGFWRGEHEGKSLFWRGGVEGTETSLPEAIVATLEAEADLIVKRTGATPEAELIRTRPETEGPSLGETATALAEDAPKPSPPAPDAPTGAGVTIRGKNR